MPPRQLRRHTLERTHANSHSCRRHRQLRHLLRHYAPHDHGGQQYVLNSHDHYSTLYSPYLLSRKSDAFSAIKRYLATCNSHRVTVRRMHADNAGDLTSKAYPRFLAAARHATYDNLAARAATEWSLRTSVAYDGP
eukprot:2358252-Pleurochrysis_carterae.AAC.1